MNYSDQKFIAYTVLAGFVFLLVLFWADSIDTPREVILKDSGPTRFQFTHTEADVDGWIPHAALKTPAAETLDENGWLVKRYAPAPGSAGQIRDVTSFGEALKKLASRPDVRRVIEIGTWYGQGSTAVIGRALKETAYRAERESEKSGPLFERAKGRRLGAKFLWSLEIFEPAWQHAREFVAREELPVRCILGGTVSSNGMLPAAAIDEAEKTNPDSHYSQYYARDKLLSMDSEPWLFALCMTHGPVDAVLIDGNEYSGLAEYKVVDAVCKPRFLALHDTNTLKTERIEMLISSGKTHWVLWESGKDAVSWSIYVHKEYESAARVIDW